MNYSTYKNFAKRSGVAMPKVTLRLPKSVLMTAITVFAAVAAVGSCQAAELPEAPSSMVQPFSPRVAAGPSRTRVVAGAENTPVIDKTFVSLAIISTGSTFADSYTTLFARENWLARKQGVCNAEVQSAYLYGTHPTVGRAYAVASVKSAGSILAGYYLRKHHSRFWGLPLLANSAISLEGVTQNMLACN